MSGTTGNGRRVWSRTMTAELDRHLVAQFRPDMVPSGTTATRIAGEPVGVSGRLHCGTIRATVEITDTATVSIQGRHYPTHFWQEVTEPFTSTETRDIPAMSELRAVIAHNTGAVTATLKPHA